MLCLPTVSTSPANVFAMWMVNKGQLLVTPDSEHCFPGYSDRSDEHWERR
jgi:hypothetical protein